MSSSATDMARRNVAMERVAASTPVPIEVGTTAAAAQMKAMVESRFVMALKKPRNMEQVRQDLLKECSRPSFALEDEEGKGNGALYSRPVGGGRAIEGLGIRFAEVAVRCMGNVMVGAVTIQEDEHQRIKYCYVLDLENNDSWEDTVHISKTVERREPRPGDNVLSVRTNSTGQQVYTIAASEDALTTKEGALISKKLRTLSLRLIPGDLQDECIREIKRVRRQRITQDPDAAIRKVIDGMAMQHVTVTMLEEYLGHAVQQCTPAEIANLQGVYASLRDGEATWPEIMDNIEEARQRKPKAAAEQKTRGVEAAKEKAAVEQSTATQAPSPAAPPPPQEQPAPVAQPTPTAQPPQQPAPVAQTTAQPEAQPATTGSAPPWATQPPPAQATTQPVAQTPPPPAQPTATAQPATEGRTIKGVKFPAVLTYTSDADKATPEQLQRAAEALQALNMRKGGSFTLKSTVKSWFEVEPEQLNQQAVECVIQVLNNWK